MSFPAFQVAGPIYMLKPLTAGGRRTMMQICASPSPRFRLRSPKIRKKITPVLQAKCGWDFQFKKRDSAPYPQTIYHTAGIEYFKSNTYRAACYASRFTF